jgi:thiol:disulfide interchange protein
VPDPVADGLWAPYDPADVAAQLAAGHSVFVSFTADWCITCKLNEHRVLGNARVLDAFSRLDIARFEADWTRRDEGIRRELERFGRAGVPMYLVYHPETPDRPTRLPELLRIDEVISALSAPRRPATVTPDTPSDSQQSM